MKATYKESNKLLLSRRDTIKSITLFTGYALTAGATTAFISGCKTDTSLNWSPEILSSDQLQLVKLATERILPKTDTPGANDAMVHTYIDNALSKVYKEKDRERFLKNLEAFDNISREKYKKKFNELNVDKMDDVLKILAQEWKDSKKNDAIFKELRDLTITGFATSEIGAKEFFLYDPIPGPYQGCIPYSEVGRNYAL